MTWDIEDAKQHLSELLDAVAEQPQFICDRDRPIAVVVKAEVFQEFLAWQQRQQSTLADAFATLRDICAEENYQLEVPARCDRPNYFIEDEDCQISLFNPFAEI